MAYSGGRDSTALLHATLVAAMASGVHVVALHVHHGLSARADDWLAHCRAQCDTWAAAGFPLRFAFQKLCTQPGRGDSVEAWARTQRYRALGAMALQEGAELVLLAHHQRDQAETFVLQALRGAGVAGLAAMPPETQGAGLRWARPWLAHARADIDAYIALHRLRHVEDDSNQQRRFARNRLRLGVWPALVDHFPGAEAKFADAAQWAQEAAACLHEVALADLALISPEPHRLGVQAWAALSPARRSNALRGWLKLQMGQPAPGSLAQRLLAELDRPGPAQWPAPQGVLRRYRGQLSYHARDTAHGAAPEPRENTLIIDGAGEYPLPGWGGCLSVVAARERGLPMAGPLELALMPRHATARFQSGLGRPARSLKKQFQQQGLAAWAREGPMVYHQAQLIYVPGLGIDARAWATPGESQFVFQWRML